MSSKATNYPVTDGPGKWGLNQALWVGESVIFSLSIDGKTTPFGFKVWGIEIDTNPANHLRNKMTVQFVCDATPLQRNGSERVIGFIEYNARIRKGKLVILASQ